MTQNDNKKRIAENKKQNGIINLNDPLLMALKAVNFISGSSMEEADLKRHRKVMERAGKLAAPKGDIDVTPFTVGKIKCEAVKPHLAHNPEYAILYAHGGGYVTGRLDYARILAAKLAISTGFTTYSFDYRLAPEHPYPAALHDGKAVWDFLTKEAYAPDHVFIAGDSAGGNLALCLAEDLLSEGREVPKGLLLFSPWTDMTGTSETYETNKDRDPILTKEYVMGAAKAYTAGAGELSDPRFSPLFGKLDGLPHTLIMCGRNGILLDDSVRLYDMMTKAGGKATLDIEENGWHVYQQMPLPIAAQAMKRLSAYVSSEVYKTDKKCFLEIQK